MPSEVTAATSEILLLEANEDTAALVRMAAEAGHLSVVSQCLDILPFLCRTGEYANAARPDLILFDLDSLGGDECKIVTEIKRDPRFRRIPVVVLASSQSYEDIHKAYDLYANAYLCKPTDKGELLKLIRATLRFWLGLVRLPRENSAT